MWNLKVITKQVLSSLIFMWNLKAWYILYHNDIKFFDKHILANIAAQISQEQSD